MNSYFGVFYGCMANNQLEILKGPKFEDSMTDATAILKPEILLLTPATYPSCPL